MGKVNKVDYNKVLEEARRAEFEYCRKDFIYFISNYCVIEDKDAEPIIQQFKPWDGQKQLIEELKKNKLVCILKARQLGITWIAIYWALWAIIFHKGKSVIALSKNEEDSKEIIRRAGLVLDNMGSLLKGGNVTFVKTAMQIVVSYGNSKVKGWIKSFTASENSGRSFTANILLLDEWAHQQYARQIWTSTFPTINRPNGGQVIGLSTMNRGTLFEDIIIGAPDNGFKVCFLPWWTDPRRDEKWYENTVKAMGLSLARQEYPASIEEALSNAEGAFFKEFRHDIHTCEPFAIPSHWRKYTTMDYGLDMLAHYNIYTDTEGFVYVTDEIYEKNLTVNQATERILNKAPNSDGLTRFAPPDLWNRQTSTGKSAAIMFHENGINLNKSNNDVISGLLAVKGLLEVVQDIDGAATSRLKIFTTCTNLIRCFVAIQTDPNDARRTSNKNHELTHSIDAIRYFAISWVKPAVIQRQKNKRLGKTNVFNIFSSKKRVPINRILGAGQRIEVI